MAKVVDAANPHRVLFEGPAEEAHRFKNQHEPRPHVAEGQVLHQLQVVEDELSHDAGNEEVL